MDGIRINLETLGLKEKDVSKTPFHEERTRKLDAVHLGVSSSGVFSQIDRGSGDGIMINLNRLEE